MKRVLLRKNIRNSMNKPFYIAPVIEEISVCKASILCSSQYSGTTQGYEYDSVDYSELD